MPWAHFDDERQRGRDELLEFLERDDEDAEGDEEELDEAPAYICDNGHTFDKSMRRYADVFCPECGTTEVGRNAEAYA